MGIVLRFTALFFGIGLVKAIAEDHNLWYVFWCTLFGVIVGTIIYAVPSLRRRSRI